LSTHLLSWKFETSWPEPLNPRRRYGPMCSVLRCC